MTGTVLGTRGRGSCLFWLFVLSSWLSAMPVAAEEYAPFPIMRPDRETLSRWVRDYARAPEAQPSRGLAPRARVAGSLTLLDRLNYVPAERDQNVCGNCWVWSATGIMEIALDVQDGLFERLSVQYLNSCGPTGQSYACCGGNLSDFVGFYLKTGGAVPWNNRSASFQDGTLRCEDGRSTTACGSLGLNPTRPLASLQNEKILTQGVGTARAIANIKTLLDENRAVQFSFYLADDGDWGSFYNFWANQGEEAIVNLDYACGRVFDEDQGGGHSVLCVGYNDDDPAASYWIMVNSWGAIEELRPQGTFRLDMNMNYDCTLVFEDGVGSSAYWETLYVDYGSGPLVNTEPAGSVSASAAVLNGTVNPKGEATDYAFEYGPSIPYQNITGFSPAGDGTEPVTISAGISGLRPGATYSYRAVARGPAEVNYGADRSFTTPSPGGFIVGDRKLGNSDDDLCLVATAAYGSAREPQVQTLRAFRDRFLLSGPAGRALVAGYYRCSPPLAAAIARHPAWRGLVRWGLLPATGMSWLALHLSR